MMMSQQSRRTMLEKAGQKAGGSGGGRAGDRHSEDGGLMELQTERQL